jgi:hypothetical protein
MLCNCVQLTLMGAELVDYAFKAMENTLGNQGS